MHVGEDPRTHTQRTGTGQRNAFTGAVENDL